MPYEFRGVPLKAIVGAPLKAAADANGMLARAQTQFILSTCFEPSEMNPSILRPKLLIFNIERYMVHHDGQTATEKAGIEMAVPLLTLLPMNSLAIHELNVCFEMEVKSITEKEVNATTGGVEGGESEDDSVFYEMLGALANSPKCLIPNQTHPNRSIPHALYDVTMQADRLPLPKGLNTIIDLLTKNIAPIHLKPGDIPAEYIT